MASATLSLGSAGYDLLEAISYPDDSQLNVSKAGNSYQINSTVKGVAIDALGLTTGAFVTNPSQSTSDWLQKPGSTAQSSFLTSSNVNIFSDVSNFNAALGAQADTLNIFGSVSGSLIELDNKDDPTGNFNDILNIQGDLKSGSNDVNTIFSGGGNDTIRIAGSAEDANIFLGFGNDSLVISKDATNVDVKGDDSGDVNGNDYIEFRGNAFNTRVNSGGGADTVVFAKGLNSEQSDLGSDDTYFNDGLPTPLTGLAAVELGSGNDSLVLGKGAHFENATFNTGSGNDTISIGAAEFSNVKFQLDGFHDTDTNGDYAQNFTGGDKLTTAANSWFTSSEFYSNNSLGDTLVFGSGNIFSDTNVYLGQGNDSIVFGGGSSFNYLATNSTISTGFGADTIVFGSNSSFNGNFNLDLGNDDAVDVVRFGVNNQFLPNDLTSEFRIIGAVDNDMLFVGAQAYRYDTSYDTWVIEGNDSLSYNQG
jgi:hypothetical protein